MQNLQLCECPNSWSQSIQLRNVMNRQGWSRFLVTKMLTRMGFSPQAVLNCTAPTAISRLHDVAKISCGYPRMIAPAVLGLVQLVTGYGFYRSANSVVALAVIFAFEVIEDVCHHWEVLPFAPVPMAAAQYFASLDRFSPYQSTVPAMPLENSPRPPDAETSTTAAALESPKSHVSRTSRTSHGSDDSDSGRDFQLPPRRKSISSAISTGGVETGVSGVVRRWWGQDLKVHTAFRLWHLRSWRAPQVYPGLRTAWDACHRGVLSWSSY